jgi:hypothetical protein
LRDSEIRRNYERNKLNNPLDKEDGTEDGVADFAYNYYKIKILSYYVGREWGWEAVGVNGEVK